MKNVLFLCTGNFYRSKFAEAYTQYLSDMMDLGLNCYSAGFEVGKADYAIEKYGCISPFTRDRIRMYNAEKYLSEGNQQLTQELIDKSDYVVIIDVDEHMVYFKDYNFVNVIIEEWRIKDIFDWAPKITLDHLVINCQNFANGMWQNDI